MAKKVEQYYVKVGEKEAPKQLDLFPVSHEQAQDEYLANLEKMVSEIQSRRKWHAIDKRMLFRNVFQSFNLYPIRTSKVHLKRARIRSSSSEALNSDWSNVGVDLALALIKEHYRAQKSSKQHG